MSKWRAIHDHRNGSWLGEVEHQQMRPVPRASADMQQRYREDKLLRCNCSNNSYPRSRPNNSCAAANRESESSRTRRLFLAERCSPVESSTSPWGGRRDRSGSWHSRCTTPAPPRTLHRAKKFWTDIESHNSLLPGQRAWTASRTGEDPSKREPMPLFSYRNFHF